MRRGKEEIASWQLKVQKKGRRESCEDGNAFRIGAKFSFESKKKKKKNCNSEKGEKKKKENIILRTKELILSASERHVS